MTASLSHGGTLGSVCSSLETEYRSKSSPYSLPLLFDCAPLMRSSSSTRAMLHSKSGVTSSVLAADDESLAEVSLRGSFASLETCLLQCDLLALGEKLDQDLTT